jgi:poly(3-hydroxybutyrate) depolymerase
MLELVSGIAPAARGRRTLPHCGNHAPSHGASTTWIRGAIYIAGLSAGGAMAAILGATYPDLYAAVGVHSGLAPGSAHDLPSALQAMQQGGRARQTRVDGAVPLILFHGDCDFTVRPATPITSSSNGRLPLRPQLRAQRPHPQRCIRVRCLAGEPIPARSTRITEDSRSWSGGTIHGAGHAWSGGSHSGTYTDPPGPMHRASGALLFEHPRPTATPQYAR